MELLGRQVAVPAGFQDAQQLHALARRAQAGFLEAGEAAGERTGVVHPLHIVDKPAK
jgi:hypothetical protein